MKNNIFSILCFSLFFMSIGVYAQENKAETPKSATATAADLAKKLANPISSLISVPFQNNTDIGIGRFEGTRNTLNFQPVIPLKLSENLNLITRVIIPVVSQYNITGVGQSEFGIANSTVSTWISPSTSKNGLIWGAGPAFLLPSSNKYLGSEKSGIGPTIILLKQSKGLTYGMLVNQLWSVMGPTVDVAEVSSMFLQGFLVYNWKTGAGVGISSENTFNWISNSNNSYLIPSITGLTKLGTQMVQLRIGPRIPLIFSDSESRPDFGVRASVVFVFPK
jgi:hypothetical protein